METAAILVHSLNKFSLCTKMAAVVVAKLLLCCDIVCKCSIEGEEHNQVAELPSEMIGNYIF